MSSAWNWIGIFLWLILIAYVLWMVNNVHSRKKRLLKVALNRKKHGASADISSNNFMVTSVEVIILLVFLAGLGKTTLIHHINNKNSIVSSKVANLDWTHTKINKKQPTVKPHNYLLMINRNRSRAYRQTYDFMVDGQKDHSSNSNTLIANNMSQIRNNHNLPYLVQKAVNRKVNAGRANRAWTLRINTRYRNTLANGIGLHAGQKKGFYTIIYVPGSQKNGVYMNTKKLQKKSTHKMA